MKREYFGYPNASTYGDAKGFIGYYQLIQYLCDCLELLKKHSDTGQSAISTETTHQ